MSKQQHRGTTGWQPWAGGMFASLALVGVLVSCAQILGLDKQLPNAAAVTDARAEAGESDAGSDECVPREAEDVPNALYVSPEGNDDAGGTRSAPLQTLRTALQKRREGKTGPIYLCNDSTNGGVSYNGAFTVDSNPTIVQGGYDDCINWKRCSQGKFVPTQIRPQEGQTLPTITVRASDAQLDGLDVEGYEQNAAVSVESSQGTADGGVVLRASRLSGDLSSTASMQGTTGLFVDGGKVSLDQVVVQGGAGNSNTGAYGSAGVQARGGVLIVDQGEIHSGTGTCSPSGCRAAIGLLVGDGAAVKVRGGLVEIDPKEWADNVTRTSLGVNIDRFSTLVMRDSTVRGTRAVNDMATAGPYINAISSYGKTVTLDRVKIGLGEVSGTNSRCDAVVVYEGDFTMTNSAVLAGCTSQSAKFAGATGLEFQANAAGHLFHNTVYLLRDTDLGGYSDVVPDAGGRMPLEFVNNLVFGKSRGVEINNCAPVPQRFEGNAFVGTGAFVRCDAGNIAFDGGASNVGLVAGPVFAIDENRTAEALFAGGWPLNPSTTNGCAVARSGVALGPDSGLEKDITGADRQTGRPSIGAWELKMGAECP
jgi:hypothetical protein